MKNLTNKPQDQELQALKNAILSYRSESKNESKSLSQESIIIDTTSDLKSESKTADEKPDNINFLENLQHALSIKPKELNDIKADAKQFEPLAQKMLIMLATNSKGLESDEKNTPNLARAKEFNEATEIAMDFHIPQLESLAALTDMISNTSKFIGKDNMPLSDKDRSTIKENLNKFKENYPDSEYIHLANQITKNLDSRSTYDGDKIGNYQHQTLNQVLEASHIQENVLQSLKKHANKLLSIEDIEKKPVETTLDLAEKIVTLPPGASRLAKLADKGLDFLSHNSEDHPTNKFLSPDKFAEIRRERDDFLSTGMGNKRFFCPEINLADSQPVIEISPEKFAEINKERAEFLSTRMGNKRTFDPENFTGIKEITSVISNLKGAATTLPATTLPDLIKQQTRDQEQKKTTGNTTGNTSGRTNGRTITL